MTNKYHIDASSVKCIKIYINDLLHVYIKKEDLTGLQSWIEGASNSHVKTYHIEFYTKNGEIECVYDSKEKWTELLKLLNEKI